MSASITIEETGTTTVVEVYSGVSVGDAVTHTGEVTGSTALTVNPGGTVAVATGDLVLIQDVSSSNSLQRVTAQSIADLGGGGGDEILSKIGATGTGRVTANYTAMTTIGPYELYPGTIHPAAKGMLVLGASFVRGGTPAKPMVEIQTTGTSGDTCYYVMYALDANGLPTGSPVYQWGPFATGSSAGGTEVTLTGQTVTITEGIYWCGVFAPTGNTGSVSLRGGSSALMIAPGTGYQHRSALYSGDTAASTPPSVTSFTFSTDGATGFRGYYRAFPSLYAMA